MLSSADTVQKTKRLTVRSIAGSEHIAQDPSSLYRPSSAASTAAASRGGGIKHESQVAGFLRRNRNEPKRATSDPSHRSTPQTSVSRSFSVLFDTAAASRHISSPCRLVVFGLRTPNFQEALIPIFCFLTAAVALMQANKTLGQGNWISETGSPQAGRWGIRGME